jgi:restriction system protein
MIGSLSLYFCSEKTTKQQIDEEAPKFSDLEQLAKDKIAKFITKKFKGHRMAMLVEAILQAQGYTTYRSPEGPDRDIDILAAPGLLGFGSPTLCVQVKTGDTPVDRRTLDQLIGAMQNVNAEQELLVSWAGIKPSIVSLNRENPFIFSPPPDQETSDIASFESH